MITTYILENNVWSSISDADYGRGENSIANLTEVGRGAMAAHWGNGDDMDEQLASIGGDVSLEVTERHENEVIATARSADGKHSATIRVAR
jgi:hypothetical protein